MTIIISSQEVAKRLGLSVDNVKSLVKQGILQPEKRKEGDYYFSLEDITRIRSKRSPTLSEEAAQVGIQIQREMVTSVSGLQKILKRVTFWSLLIVTSLVLLIIIIAILFKIYPEKTSDFFGYYYRFNVLNKSQALSVNPEGPQVLAAATGPGDVALRTSILADVIKPMTVPSLLVVKVTDRTTYEQIVTNPSLGTGSSGPAGSQGPAGPAGSQGPAGPRGSQGLQGAAGTNSSSNASEADTLSSVTARGATTTTGVTFSGGATIATVNGLTLTEASDGLTLAGGTTSRTLTLTGADVTIGSTINPTSAGALSILSNGAYALTLDAGGASSVDIGTINASALTIGRSTVTTTISGTTDANNLKIGSGTTILKHLSVTTTFDASEIAKATCSNAATVTVTGANVGDTVMATPTSTSGGVETLDVSWNSFISSDNTVTIRICNVGNKQDPPNQTWRVDVWQH